MAAANLYLGLKRGDNDNPGNVVAGAASNGTASDVEVRIQTDNGSGATGITRMDVNLLLEQILLFVNSGGATGDGTGLPAT